MADTRDLEKIAGEIGGNVYHVSLNPAESARDKEARIKHETRVFWMGHIWMAVILALLSATMAVCFSYVSHTDVAVAQWARAAVLTLVSSGIAFIAGRLSSPR